MSEERTHKRLEMLEALVAKGSSDPFHHYARAMELRALRRGEDALSAFGEVAERFPDYVPTYLMAGQLCAEAKRDEDARRWFEQGIERAEAAGDAHAKSELQSALDEL